ncbi:MAG: membrane protein insertion efficiency factor YidD [Mariprofundaceae bacterium]
MGKRIVRGLVRAYQLCISPLLPSRCIHTPTCSSYMIEAVEQHGVLRGVWLGCKRLLRCHPFSRGGYDPVPK